MYKGMHAPTENTIPKIDKVAKRNWLVGWLTGVDFYVMRFNDKGNDSTTATDIKIINYIWKSL